MEGKTTLEKYTLIFLMAVLLILAAVAGWWLGTKQTRHKAAMDAARDQNPQTNYLSQLRLVRYIRQPFRFEFNAWDGDPKKPGSLTFQINTLDVRQPSQFAKIGDVIAGTKFKVTTFGYIPSSGFAMGESTVTLQNTETGANIVLTLERIVDTPDSYALFRYLWNNTEFEVKKNTEFVLPRNPLSGTG